MTRTAVPQSCSVIVAVVVNRREQHMSEISPETIASMIDHTLLKPDTSREQVEQACKEAVARGFAAVCIPPNLIQCAVAALRGSKVAPCTVVGFPMGTTTTAAKAFEAGDAAGNGARELDMVLAVAELKAGNSDYVLEDIRAVAAAAPDCTIKVIIETCLLTDDEKRLASELVARAGAHFVKTSTGLAGGGASVADILLIREVVGPEFGVKASGGIQNLDDAAAMVKAGANRLGTSSALGFLP